MAKPTFPALKNQTSTFAGTKDVQRHARGGRWESANNQAMSMARAMKSGAGSRIAAREAPRSAARVVRVLSHSRRGGNLPADERRASGRTEKAQAPRALEESLSELSYKVASLPDLQQAVSLPPLPDGTEGVNKVQLATSCIVLCIQVALLGLGRKGGEEVEDEGAPEYATELQEDIETLKSRVESLKVTNSPVLSVTPRR